MKKNKIWKRVGAVILSTALLFGTLQTGVMAEETVGQDTNEEELLSEEVVSADEPADESAEEILPEEVSSEEDAAEMDYDTAEAESEVSESTGETDESETDLQYHFTEGDVASILTWKEQYFSEGYEQLLSQDESWWDGLYDYERGPGGISGQYCAGYIGAGVSGAGSGAVSGDSGYGCERTGFLSGNSI